MIVVWIPAQNHTQIYTLVLILGRNLLLSSIYLRSNPLSCLHKITCFRVERIVAPKKSSLTESDSNLPLKEKQITKKKNVSNTLLSNANSEKKKLIKNDRKRTSSKEPFNQPSKEKKATMKKKLLLRSLKNFCYTLVYKS